jgi:hypothetical protein
MIDNTYSYHVRVGSAYYLLDDFNHHHHHAVLAATSSIPSVRYSSTHRLLRAGGNVESLLSRCASAINNFNKKSLRIFRGEQQLLSEIEGEWLRMFYIQGAAHHLSHWAEWGIWVNELLRYWEKLEERTRWMLFDFLRPAAENSVGYEDEHDGGKLRKKRSKAGQVLEEMLSRGDVGDEGESALGASRTSIITSLFSGIAETLVDRSVRRGLWKEREEDLLWKSMPEDARPIAVPLVFTAMGVKTVGTYFEITSQGPLSIRAMSPLPENLTAIATRLQRWGDIVLTKKFRHEDFNIEELIAHPIPAPTASTAVPGQRGWTGWDSGQFCLEMQTPFAMLLLTGRKTIETRAYPLPSELLHRRIQILQTKSGADAVSVLGVAVEFTKQELEDKGASLIGWVIFDRVVEYTDRNSFEADESKHKVLKGSGYGWRANDTTTLYGWVVKNYKRAVFDKQYTGITRRMRSLFEIQRVHNHAQTREITPIAAAGSKSTVVKTDVIVQSSSKQKKRQRDEPTKVTSDSVGISKKAGTVKHEPGRRSSHMSAEDESYELPKSNKMRKKKARF